MAWRSPVEVKITGPLSVIALKRFTQKAAEMWLRHAGTHHVLNCKDVRCVKTRKFLYKGLLTATLGSEVSDLVEKTVPKEGQVYYYINTPNGSYQQVTTSGGNAFVVKGTIQ